MSSTTTSPCGTWMLRYKDDHVINAAGYGNGGWQYDLIECASGAIIHSWTGFAMSSPWDASSSGVANVVWDGDGLVVTYCPTEGLHSEGAVERVLPASLKK